VDGAEANNAAAVATPNEVSNAEGGVVAPSKPPGAGPAAAGPLAEKRLGSKQRLRPVEVVMHRMQEDAVRHLDYIAQRKTKDKELLNTIAQMKDDLRGDFLSNVPLLSVCPALHEQLVGQLRACRYERGQKIIVEGDVGDTMFIIERGICSVQKEINRTLVSVGQLGKGAFFGEIGMLYDMPRTATVVATTDASLLALSRKDLFAILTEEDHQKMQLIARTQIFANVPMLARLSVMQKVRIAESLKTQEWAQGAVLAGEMHTSVRIVIIEQGKVLMQVRDVERLPNYMQNTTDFTGFTLGPGQYFGMRGLLFGAPVGFTVTALTEKVRTISMTLDEILAGGETPEEKQEISTCINDAMRAFLMREAPPIQRLTDFHFDEILKKVETYQVKKWDVVFAKGQEMDAIYILEEGKLVRYDGDVETLTEHSDGNIPCKEASAPGEFFGTDTLIRPKATSGCTLVALTDATLLRIRPEVVREVMEEERRYLARVPIFSGSVLDKDDQFRLVGQLRPWNFKHGHCIVREGDHFDKMYIIEHGVCDVLKRINGKDVVVGNLQKGSYFGEGAVLVDGPSKTTVRAANEVTAVSISREDLDNTLSEETMEKIRRMGRTQIFQSIAVLSELSTSMKVKMAERLREERWKPEELIASEDDETEFLRIVEEGNVVMEVENGDNLLPGADDSVEGLSSTRYGGSFFGAVGLLHRMPMGVTVKAGEETVVTRSLSLDDIKACADGGELDAVLRTMQRGLRGFLLAQVPEIGALGKLKIENLLGSLEEVTYNKGDVIIPRGHAPVGMQLLERGELAEVNMDAAEIEEGKDWEQKVLSTKAVSGFYYGMSRSFKGMSLPFSVVATKESLVLFLPEGYV